MDFKIIPPFKAAEMAETLNPSKTLGVEVTIPVLEAKCGLGNIDHHRPGDDENTPAACQQAMDWEPLPEDATVVGVLGDADTLTAMAILFAKAKKQIPNENLVKKVGHIDRYGPAKSWKIMQDYSIRAIRAIAGRRDISTMEQVAFISIIITSDRIPKVVESYIAESDLVLKSAQKASKVKLLKKDVVLVESSHQMATQIGYQHGDVLICLNPAMMKDFKDPSAGTFRKFTVCKRDANVPAVIDFDALNALEPGWGGRPTVGGSPQGVDSVLSVEQVLSCIKV